MMLDSNMHPCPDLKAVEESLSARLPQGEEALDRAMAYSLLGGGKRVRAVLVHLCGTAVGLSYDQLEPYASAIEMIHAYSLIHDDLPAMDNDDFRRGKPSCHRAFGEGMAILAGDALLNTAMNILFEAAEDGKAALEAAAYMARMAGTDGMIKGQAIDLEETSRHGQSQERLRQMQEGKTAALMMASTVSPILRAASSRELIELFEKLGYAFGMAFQIQDDLLDEDPEAELGKTQGKDQASGKLTTLSVYGKEGGEILLNRYLEEIRQLISQAEKGGLKVAQLRSYLEKLAVRKR